MHKKYYFSDIFMTLFLVLIGAAQAANLAGIAFQRTISECSGLFLLALIVGTVGITGIAVLIRKKSKDMQESQGYTPKEYVLLGLFITVFVSQVLYLVLGEKVYRTGDMTVETVQSFLQTDYIYRLNPMTGKEYTLGIPSRLKILCLPTLYTIICQQTKATPCTVVWEIVPITTLIFSYCAFSCVSRALFTESREKRLIFMIFTAVLMWVGSYVFVMDGFGLLFAGWRGVTIRNLVLVPYTIFLCLRKKYLHALLCVFAEACIVWTLYGLGVCIVVIVGMCMTQVLVSRSKKREEGN